MELDPLEFITKKKLGESHSPEEIHAFIKELVEGKIPDYQVSAWLMAVCFKGLDFDETFSLTDAMAHSGKVFSWDNSGLPVVDKHSTGGVGDTVTLVLAPMAAAMGMRMGKHSGRGLGHTGGTIDKLESIPGFTTSIDEKRFKKIVNDVGCAVAGQDIEMTPADGILYSLRDVTSTVNNEALIAASIMSKKIAGGAPNILLDVKVGSGAFMKDEFEARSLADLMMKLGRKAGLNVFAILTSMDQPLGNSIGNALEVAEAIKILKNETDVSESLRHICIRFASELARLSGNTGLRDAQDLARNTLESGAALDKFRRMIIAQNGDPGVIDNPEMLPVSDRIIPVQAGENGFIAGCDALELGEVVRDLGGGRKSKDDIIDPSVGLVLHKRVGDQVKTGDLICEIHSNGKLDDNPAIQKVRSAFQITQETVKSPALFLD